MFDTTVVSIVNMENENQETSVAVIEQQPVAVAGDIQLTATAPDEIAQAQSSLIEWCKQKISGLQADYAEMKGAYENALAHKWSAAPLGRQADKIEKRVEFYQKMLGALEAGYVIIPNFPVTVFAIRTNKDKPLKLMGHSFYDTHEQKAESLHGGTGVYQNPFPAARKREVPAPTQENPNKKEMQYWASDWKELEFPIQMAKLKIMEATNKAMALKLFDDFGIMPERKKEDPIIVARLLDPRSDRHNRRYVTFMVAWHLNTRDL